MALPNTFSVCLDNVQASRLEFWRKALGGPNKRVPKAEVIRMAFECFDTLMTHKATLPGMYRFVYDDGEIGDPLWPTPYIPDNGGNDDQAT